MKCDECCEMLNEYVDGTLTSDSKEIVDAHLSTCDQCHRELQSLRLLLTNAKQLPCDIQPGRDLWEGIAGRIHQSQIETVQRRQNNFVAKHFSLESFWQTPAFARFGVAFALLAVAMVTFWFTTRERLTGWEIAAVTGIPQVDDDGVTQPNSIGSGNVIVTDGNSSATISNVAVGNVRIEPNSTLRLLHAEQGEHRFALEHGNIKASTWVPPRVFVVETPSAVAVDLGCEYQLTVDSVGSGRLLVTTGWVALEWAEKVSIVPSAAFCEIRPGVGPGTPYSEYSSDTLRRSLEQFDFSNGGERSLEIVLENARKNDAVTLWHLLSRVTNSQRENVYSRFASILPPPEGVTREGILKLDEAMLNAWWEEFEVMPLSKSNPSINSNPKSGS